jgi:hypothetical protein
LGRQRGAHVVERLGALLLDAGWRAGRRYFILAWPAALALWRLGGRLMVWDAAAGFLARFDLRGITRYMTDDVSAQVLTDDVFMNPFGQALRVVLPRISRKVLVRAFAAV